MLNAKSARTGGHGAPSRGAGRGPCRGSCRWQSRCCSGHAAAQSLTKRVCSRSARQRVFARPPPRLALTSRSILRSFAPGACVAFSPTANDRGLTVFLDAGHDGIDPGAAVTTESGQIIYESHETLAVELDTMTILRRQGFRVVVSRTRDTSLIRLGPGDISGGILTAHGSHSDAVARDGCANDAHADVLVGIYFNAGGPSNAGCRTAYDAVRPFAAENRQPARVVEADVLAAMNARGWEFPTTEPFPTRGLVRL